MALNIGGIANVTVIPAQAKPGEVVGFDTGPGNMVSDALVRHFTGDREYYDAGGRARGGRQSERNRPCRRARPSFLPTTSS